MSQILANTDGQTHVFIQHDCGVSDGFSLKQDVLSWFNISTLDVLSSHIFFFFSAF